MPEFVLSAHAKHRITCWLGLTAWLFFALSAYSFRPDIPALRAAAMQSSDDIVVEMFQPRTGATNGFWLAVAGGVVLGLALWVGRKNDTDVGTASIASADPKHATSVGVQRDAPARQIRSERIPIRWRLVFSGVFLLWLVGEINGSALNFSPLIGVSPHIQFVLFCAGILLTGTGLTGGNTSTIFKKKRVNAKTQSTQRRQMDSKRRWSLFAITGIVLLAFILRFWQLNTSLRVLVDELHFMSGILEFWKRGNVELMQGINSISPFARLYPYWQDWTVEILGRNFLGFRAVSALFGTINVLAIYWLAKALFDRKTALLAALFLATFPPHLHFSRLGIIQTGDMLAGSLTLAFTARGMRSGRRVDWVIAGICLGMTQYFYEGGRFLFPLIMFFWVGSVAVFGRGGKGRALSVHRRDVAILVLMAVIVAMPLYYTITFTEAPLTGRFDASGFGENYWVTLLLSPFDAGWFRAHLNHLVSSFLVYVHMPERAVYYGGYHPFVLEALVPMFLMGVWYSVWRGRAAASVLLLWVFFTSLGSGLLVQSAVASRFVVVFPALALLMAVGLRYGLALVWPNNQTSPGAQHVVPLPQTATRVGAQRAAPLRQPMPHAADAIDRVPTRQSNRIAARYTTILFLTGIIIAGAQAAYYFYDHLPTFNVEFRHARAYRDVEDAMLRASTYPPGTQIHIVMTQEFDPNYNRVFLKFLADGLDVDTLMRSEVTTEYVDGLDIEADHVFFLEPDDSRTPALIRQRFALTAPVRSPYADVPEDEQFWLYFAAGSDYSLPPHTADNDTDRG
jgi:LPXTG-motif cell wall-anchored protein